MILTIADLRELLELVSESDMHTTNCSSEENLFESHQEMVVPSSRPQVCVHATSSSAPPGTKIPDFRKIPEATCS